MKALVKLGDEYVGEIVEELGKYRVYRRERSQGTPGNVHSPASELLASLDAAKSRAAELFPGCTILSKEIPI